MDRGVDREDEAEQQEASDQRRRQPGRRSARSPGGPGQQERDRHQKSGPEDRLAGGLCLGLTLGTKKAGGKGLHRTIGDDPECKEAADQEERLATAFGRAVRQDRLEIDRDAHHKPHVARPEQEHARQ